VNLTSEFLIKRIFSNAIFGWLSKILIGVSGIILTPILISGLGRYEYGIWVTIGQMAAFLLVADLGVANSIGRLVAKYDAIKSTDQKNKIYSTSLAILILVMIVIVAFSLMFLNYIPEGLGIKNEYKDIVVTVFIIMLINVSLSFPLRIGRGLLQAVHRFDTIDIILTIIKILQLIFIFILFYFYDMSLINLALLISVTNISADLIIFIKSYRAHKGINFNFKFISKISAKEIFSMGGASVLLSTSGVLTNQGFIFLVSFILGVMYAPLLSVPVLLLLPIGALIGKIGITFMPMISAFDSLSQYEKIKKLSIYGSKYTFMLGLFTALFFYLYGRSLFFIWLPSNEISTYDIDIIYMVFLLLILPLVMSRSNQSNRSILLSDGSHWLISSTLSAVSIASFLLAYVLISQTSLGVYGVVIAWAIKLLVGDYLLTLFFIFKKYSIPVLSYIQKIYARPLLTIFVTALINFLSNSFIINKLSNISVEMSLLLNTIIFVLSSALLFYFLCLDRSHKALLISYFRK
jgi:O-antigen/teichoic acid export membrane protein